MGAESDREALGNQTPVTGLEPGSIISRVRIYLDAASPANAYTLLAQVVLDHEMPDETRLELLALRVSAALTLGRLEEAVAHATALERALRECPSTSCDLRVESRTLMARVSSAGGDLSFARNHLDAIKAADRAACSTAVFTSLCVAEVELLFRLGCLERAEAVASQAVERADGAGHPASLGKACTTLGTVLKADGRFPEALRLYTRAAASYHAAGDYSGLAFVHLNRAALLNRIGHLPEARAAYEEAYRRSREISHAANITRSRLGQGMVAIRQGRLDAARRHLLEGWLEARRQRAPREQALALEFLGEALTLMGRPEPARRALALCRRIATRIAPEGDLVAECGIREAFLALTQGDLAGAETLAATAQAGSSRAGFTWEEAQALRLRGAALCLLGRRDEARACLQAAHDKLRTMGEQLEVQLVRRWLALLDGEAAGGEPPIHPALMAASHRTSPLQAVPAAFTDAPIDGATDGRNDSIALNGNVRREGSSCRNGDHGRSGGLRRGGSNRRGGNNGAHETWRRLGLATKSPRLLSMLREAEMLALADCAVLVQGETGTGKELLARGIHELSGRSGRLVPVNVGALPPELLESELFGSEKGAYTGADQARRGLVVEAEDGTLFLDEIGDISPRGQVALLRFLDSGEIRPVGSSRISRVKLGVITATNRPLKERIRHDAFRRDLYYRLAQGVVTLPPLRERIEDLPGLITILWDRQAPGTELPPGLLEADSLVPLRAHPWPGNVRELDQFLRRLRLSLESRSGARVSPHRIWTILGNGAVDRARSTTPGLPSTEQIRRVLRECRGNRAHAARTLGIGRSTFYRIVEERGLILPPPSSPPC
jgi:DNA-binding NtrC family response regulator/tetratricopeptide (TPR) repeat protein